MKPDELPHYTYEDYLRWEGRWELIEGIPFAMTPSPSYARQRVSQRLAYLLEQALDGCEDCEAVLPVDWRVDERTVVCPDHMVVCGRPAGDFLSRAPRLIIEIASPSTAYKDRHTKFRIYEAEGVPCYCLVYPDDRLVKVFDLQDGCYMKRLDAVDETLNFLLGPCTIALDLSRLWA